MNKNYPEKIYRTGDFVILNSFNEIIYKGRKDSQIKHLGYRIELGEIENVVLAIRYIDNACIFYNEETKNIVLVYSSKKNLDQKFIIRELQSELPKYMLPTKFILLDYIQLNANGKIDRNYLKGKYS